MARIGKMVRLIVLQRIASRWADAMNAAAVDYDVTADDVQRLAGVDWSQTRPQVFWGDLDPSSIDESASVYEPIVTAHVEVSTNDGTEKFRTWNGSTDLVIRIHWEWSKSGPATNYEEVPDLIEDAMVNILNAQTWVGSIGGGVTYRGELSITRGPVVKDGENWRRLIEVRARFGVDA